VTRPRRLVVAVSAISVLTSACAALRPARQPIPVVSYPASPTPAPCLLVLLPGRWDRVGDFERRGFVADARSTGIAADIVAVDAHLGYYRRGTILKRLRADVLQPARARGYAAVWLVGISMGGSGAILYDLNHPGEVDGIFLIAPFLGGEEIVDEVAAAGGARAWGDAGVAGKPFERDLWRWARRLARQEGAVPPVFLGYGTSDDFAPAHRLLAEVLAQERVFAETGGHDWVPWRSAWRRFLASPALSGCASGATREP